MYRLLREASSCAGKTGRTDSQRILVISDEADEVTRDLYVPESMLRRKSDRGGFSLSIR